MPKSTQLKLGITVLFVKHFKKCFAFYKDVLGLKAFFVNPDREVALFKVGGRELLLHGGHKGKPAAGPLHIHFEARDIRAAVRNLKKKGVKFHEPVAKRPYGVYETSFSDPDGNRFDLVQPIED